MEIIILIILTSIYSFAISKLINLIFNSKIEFVVKLILLLPWIQLTFILSLLGYIIISKLS
jgi:hypothetical protein